MPANEETYRSQTNLHIVFAISSIAMTLVIVWMIMADHNRPWKDVQRDFHKIETAKLKAVRDQKDLLLHTKLKDQLDAVEAEIAQAQRQDSENARAIARKEAEIKQTLAQFQKLDTEKRFQKAELDSLRSFYDGMIDLYDYERATTYRETTIQPAEKKLERLTDAYEKVVETKTRQEKELDELKGHIAELEKKRDKLTRDLMTSERILKQKQQQYGEGSFINRALAMIRGLPGIDMAAPPEKIQQISLPKLLIDYNFKQVPRYDRCTTCHLGIDKAGYDVDADLKPMPAAFASHPFLTEGATVVDPSGKTVTAGLYLDGNGPHKINSFGCTICHGGQGSATDFTYASHEPNDPEQKADWEKAHDWKEIHHWDFPMLPKRFIESSCLKCHYQVTDIPQAARLQEGYNRIVKYGCTGCHTIGGEGALGPDLTDARQVGPNLLHLKSKVSKTWTLKWIKNPHAFRPDTRMPRFYGLTNNNSAEDLPKNDAEIHAITEYLFNKSTPPPGFVDPPVKGNAAEGKLLFLQKGCMACHAHKEYSPESFPESVRDYAKANVGPNLSQMADKFPSTAQGTKWLTNWIHAPESYHPKSLMPNLQLSWQDAANIAAWIVSVPASWPEEVVVPDSTSEEVVKGLDELVALYKKKSGTPLSQVAQVVEEMSHEDKLMYLGEKTISRLGCFGCHNIAGFEKAKPIGTPLNGWGSKSPTKLDFAHIAEYLDAQPIERVKNEHGATEAVRDGTDEYFYEKLIEHTRTGFLYEKLHRPRSYDYKKTKADLKDWDERLRMPQFSWANDPKAIQDVMTFILGLTGERIDDSYMPHYAPAKDAIAKGERVLDRYNCKGCHVLAMPRYTLKPGTTIADALPKFQDNVDASYGELGRGLDYLAEFYPNLKYDPKRPPELKPDDGTESVTIEGMPTGVETDDDGKPLLQYVQLWKPVTIRGYTFNTGDNLAVALDPKKVDKTDAEGGDFAWLYARSEADRTSGDFASYWNRLPPPLVREGKKVQTPWLTRFLKDPYPIRPAANLRMPRFHFDQTAAETRDLANYFAATDGAEFPYQDVPQRGQSYLAEEESRHRDYFKAGWNIMATKGAPCLQCHAIGANKPTGGAQVINGPDLRQVDNRFRPEFLLEWLGRPSRLVPYTSMPQNVPPHGAPAVPVPKTFEDKPFEIVKAMRDTLLNYGTAVEEQLAAGSGETRAKPDASTAPAKPDANAKPKENKAEGGAGGE